MGVRRISVGGTLARVAMHAFIKSATEIAKEGKFDSFAGVITNAELNKFFSDDREAATNDRDREPHPHTGQPVGPPVDATPARRPGPVTLQGRYGRVEKLERRSTPRTCGTAVHGHDHDLDLHVDLRAVRRRRGVRRLARQPRARSTIPIPTPSSTATAAPSALSTLMEIRPEMRVIEVGHIVYSPALQRTPLAHRGAISAGALRVRDAGLPALRMEMQRAQRASRRAALRYGFTYEGIFRQHMIAKGRNRDTAWFSMLDSEWPARKAAFERWLAPENFAADGRQKSSLSALNGVTE